MVPWSNSQDVALSLPRRGSVTLRNRQTSLNSVRVACWFWEPEASVQLPTSETILGLSEKGSTPALQAGRKGSIPLASTNTSQVVGQNLARLIIFAETGATPVPETNLVFAVRA